MAKPSVIMLGPNASAYMRELQKGKRNPTLLTRTKALGPASKYNVPGVFQQGSGYITAVFSHTKGLLLKAECYKIPKLETVEVDMRSKQVQDADMLNGLGLTKRRVVRGETMDDIVTLDYPTATEQDLELLRKYTADGEWEVLEFNTVKFKPGMRPGAPISSMIRRLRWHQKNRIMEAAFASDGAVVVYRQVPITVWAELKLCYEKGLSVGRAFWTLVRRADSRVGGQLVGNYADDGWDGNPSQENVTATVDGRDAVDFDATSGYDSKSSSKQQAPNEMSLQELKDLAYEQRKKFLGNQDYLVLRGTDKSSMAAALARKLGIIDDKTRILTATEIKERDDKRAEEEYDRRFGGKVV